MTGTGSQTDPYIIASWADFVGMNSAATYYKMGVDLDANDYNGGVWIPMRNFAARELDGDGRKISNINASTLVLKISSAGVNISIKNLSIINCRATVLIEAGEPKCSISFDNCKIEMIGRGISYTTLPPISYTGCAITIKSLIGYTKGVCYYTQSAPTFTSCQINHEWVASGVSNYGGTFTTCRLDGKWTLTGSTAGAITVAATDCVVAPVIDVDAWAECTGLTINGSASAPTVVCSTRAGDLAISGTGAIAATATQCNDVAWLCSRGFECVEVTV